MKRQKKLSDLASIIRSKNAGPFLTTYDVFCDKKENYSLIKKSKQLNKRLLSRILNVSQDKILGIYFFDDVLGIKITIVKQGDIASGDLFCGDILGMQQYIPLRDIKIPGDLKNVNNKI